MASPSLAAEDPTPQFHMQAVDEIAQLPDLGSQLLSVRHRRTTGLEGARWHAGGCGVWQLKHLTKCLQTWCRSYTANGRRPWHEEPARVFLPSTPKNFAKRSADYDPAFRMQGAGKPDSR